jgi:Spy/CpxP family protein refolding chaperone
MRLKIFLLVIASVLAGTAGVVYVSPNMDTVSKKGKIIWQKMTEKLGLTTDQQAKFKDLNTDMHKQTKDSWAKIKTIREKVKNELLAPNPSQEVLYRYEKEINDLKGAMAERRIEHLLKVKEVLTPDQFKTLLSMRPFQGKAHGWRHGGRENRG